MDTKELEARCFNVIRRKVSDITDESSNDEIAGFVKGVVALESELFDTNVMNISKILKDNNNA